VHPYITQTLAAERIKDWQQQAAWARRAKEARRARRAWMMPAAARQVLLRSSHVPPAPARRWQAGSAPPKGDRLRPRSVGPRAPERRDVVLTVRTASVGRSRMPRAVLDGVLRLPGDPGGSR
jgi:hypothetical protein